MKVHRMPERFEIQSVSEDEIVAAFTLVRAELVKAVARSHDHEVVYESRESGRVGRVTLQPLRPNTDYSVSLSVPGEETGVHVVRTLPQPRGAQRAEFAVIADPHLTIGHENKHGRLFMESEAILRQLVADVNRRKIDFVLMPGDVTHNGSAEEMALAGSILEVLECSLFVTPGDHDMDGGKRHIYDTFGPGQWVKRLKGFTVIGCDMVDPGTGRSDFCLGPKGIDHVVSALASAEGIVILLCHRQFNPDDYIRGKASAIADHELFAKRALPKLAGPAIAYVGHKNLPARHRRENLLQLNVPQPVQYPCGFLRVRCFENGLYHNYVPLFSEVLNDASRVTANAFGADSCSESYRRGRGHHVWNFVWDHRSGRVISSRATAEVKNGEAARA